MNPPKHDYFDSSFPIFLPQISFSYVITLVSIYNVMLNNRDENSDSGILVGILVMSLLSILLALGQR